MFPKKDSDPYIKSTGERSTLGQMIGSGGGGGGSELPEYSAANAGQVLTVDDSGDLTWAEVTGGGGIAYTSVTVDNPGGTGSAQEVTV